MKDVSNIEGKEYFSPLTNEAYGVGEAFSCQLPEGFSVGAFGQPFAFDGCGNLFTENEKKQICFWDHETDEIHVISESWGFFVDFCGNVMEAGSASRKRKVWLFCSFGSS